MKLLPMKVVPSIIAVIVCVCLLVFLSKREDKWHDSARLTYISNAVENYYSQHAEMPSLGTIGLPAGTMEDVEYLYDDVRAGEVYAVSRKHHSGGCRLFLVLGDVSPREADQEELQRIVHQDDERRAAEGRDRRWQSLWSQ